MAPEVIKGTQMTTGWLKADVWSVGCTVVEMLTGRIPYHIYENPMTAMYHIANGEPPPIIDKDVSDVAISFVRQCCFADPNERPSIENLLNHPFVQINNNNNNNSTISNNNINNNVNEIFNVNNNNNLDSIHNLQSSSNHNCSFIERDEEGGGYAGEPLSIDSESDDDITFQSTKKPKSVGKNNPNNNIHKFEVEDSCNGSNSDYEDINEDCDSLATYRIGQTDDSKKIQLNSNSSYVETHQKKPGKDLFIIIIMYIIITENLLIVNFLLK